MEYTYSRLFLHLKQFLWPYKVRLVIATLLSALGSAVWLYNAYAFAQIVNFVIKYQQGQSLQPLYNIIALWIVSVIIRYTANFSSKLIGINTAEQAAIDAEMLAVKHLSHLDIAWHEKENAGNKMKRIQRGSKSFIDLIRLWLGSVVDLFVNIFGAFFIILQFDRTLAGFLVIYLIIYYFSARFTRKRGVQALQQANLKDEEITGLFFEVVSNIRTVKIMAMAKKVLENVHGKSLEYLERAHSRIFWFQSNGLIRGIWEGVGRILLIIFVIWGIFEGRYETGFLVLFYGYFNTLTRSIANLSDVALDVATAKANVGRLTEILDEKIVIDTEEGKVDFPGTWDFVKIKNLSFTYGDNIVLSGIDFEIKKGEKVGIVGLSGAGKSTIFKLLLKEYENYGGDILIGSTSLKTIKKSSYVEHIAAVLQDTEVFNMSLKDNIVFANSDEADNQELFERSLSIAHIKDFLPKLPQGIDTPIGEKGVRLSGGERQRLGIARAVFKQPEILFLDEATSHLDVESEQKIQDSLAKFFKNVTALVIAHRLSTIKEMNRIVVIEGGKIIETGTFDELYGQSGRFREFWDKQKI
jgi:ABC-type multidrug transport system fused ATPase/permease subunit